MNGLSDIIGERNTTALCQKNFQLIGGDDTDLEYDASVELDIEEWFMVPRFLLLAGDVVFTTANIAQGRRATLYITCDATPRNLTFPVGWTWVGTAPTTIAAGLTGKLTMFARGATDADVFAEWSI